MMLIKNLKNQNLKLINGKINFKFKRMIMKSYKLKFFNKMNHNKVLVMSICNNQKNIEKKLLN